MDLPTYNELIVIIGSQVLIVGTGLITAFFKIKGEFLKKVREVKIHTDISVQRLNGMLSYVINSFDQPAWIKMAHTREDGQIEFRMLELNQAYCDEFDFDRIDFVGKTDLEAGWEKKMADQFRRNDLSVWASGETQTFTEEVKGKKRRFRKLRVQSSDGTKKGVMGYEVFADPDHPEIEKP
jgi:hypothetical protein